MNQLSCSRTCDLFSAGGVPSRRRWAAFGLGRKGISDIGQTVVAIVTTYDDLGRVRSVSSEGLVNGVETVLNEAFDLYDGWGNLTKEYQKQTGEISLDQYGNSDDGTPYVGYDYCDGCPGSGVAAYLRPADVVYPNTRQIDYNYDDGTQAAIDQVMFRLSSIADDSSGQHLAQYGYLGAGTIASETYPQPQVSLNYDPNGDGSFTGWDRFGRVVDQVWADYPGQTPVTLNG